MACPNYLHGSVVSLRLENFMTYKRFHWRPSGRLNVILGPNGSGKSSLVCALCFVLAGSPSSIGRANKFSDFIAYGNSQAVIEVELYNSQGSNWKIKRELLSNNHTNSYINDTSATLKEVEKLVFSLNIQVNNLCQFLPQEKVSEFVRLTPQELLVSTEKCVGGNNMFALHSELNDAGELKLIYEKKVEDLKERHAAAISENMLLHHDVENFRQRKIMLESVKLLKQKRLLTLYMNSFADYKESLSAKEKIEKSLDESKKCLAPLEEEEQKINARISLLQEDYKSILKGSDEHTKKLNKLNDELQLLISQSDDILHAFNNTCDEERLRLNKVESLKAQAELLESEYSHYNVSLPQERLRQCDVDMKNVNDRMYNLNLRHSELSEQEKFYGLKIKEVTQGIQEIENIESERLSSLQRRNRDAYDAVLWLRKNLSKFKKPCYEPPVLSLDICNQSFAKFVEFTIPNRDFLAMFLFESSDDMELFLSEAHDKLGLNVHAGLAPSVPVYSFKPRKPIDDYKQFGFETYLREAVRAPDSVMSYLCQYFSLHRIPVGNAFTKSRIPLIAKEAPELNRFFTPDFYYTLSKSRYTGRISSFSSFVPPASFLTSSRDLVMLRKLSEQKKEFLQKVDEIKSAINSIINEKDELLKTANTLKLQKKEINDYLKKAESCNQKLIRTQETLMNCEKYKVDLKEQEMIMKRKRFNLSLEIVKKVIGQKEVVGELTDGQIKKLRTYSRLKNEKIRLAEKKSKYENELKQVEVLSNQLDQAIETCVRLKARCLDHFHEAKTYHRSNAFKFSFEDLLSKNSNYGLSTITYSRKSVKDLASLPANLEEIESAIYEYQAKADCRYAVDHNVILLYEQREASIQRLKKELTSAQNQLEDHSSSIDEKKREWLQNVKTLITKINLKFEILFKEIGCGGQVVLYVPPNENDYANYGISILVKFREGDDLHPLSVSMQSGGERSVSTMLYMIALQDLSQCPFRCVDEINQGMDTTNERKVFDLIVKHTSVRGSQYFLISPKLLKDLAFGRNVSVSIIYKGIDVMDANSLCLKAYLDNYRPPHQKPTDVKPNKARKSSYDSSSDYSDGEELRIVEDCD